MTLDKDELRKEFSALLDNELSPEDRAVVEHHLAEDADALRELHGMKLAGDLYRRMPMLQTPPGFEERVRRAVARSRGVRLRRHLERKRVWPLLISAAVFLFIVIATGYHMAQLRPGPEGRTAPASPGMPDPATELIEELGIRRSPGDAVTPEAIAGPPAAEADPSDGVYHLGERRFILQHGEFRQAEYADEPLRDVYAAGEEAQDLLDRFPELKPVLTQPAPVVIELSGTWYRILPGQQPTAAVP